MSPSHCHPPRLLSLIAALLAVCVSVPSLAQKPAKHPSHKKPVPAAATASVPASGTTAAPAAATVSPDAAALAVINTLASAGAPRLALDALEQQQPDFSQDPVGWMSFERERLYLYGSTGAWQAVIARLPQVPAGVSPDFRTWENLQAASAWLQLGQGENARAILRALIWSPQPPAADILSQTRQLIIKSYLGDQQLADAQTAVIRYRQDYPKDAGDWPVLEARLFLRTAQPQAALDVLKDVPGTEAQLLVLLAALRRGTLAPDKVLDKARALAQDAKLPVEQRVRAWFVAAEAGGDLKNPVARIEALQAGLALQSGLLLQDAVFAITPDMLWDAYLAYGTDLGNQLQLVVGDDQAWFLAASNRFDSKPVNACALFSVVAFNAPDAQQQDVAHWQFATLIQKQKSGGVVLRHLYLDSARFKDVSRVPPDVRYILVNDVLAIPDIPLASKLMQGLDAPPPDTDPAAWQLQRARVFILGGQADAGIAALKQLFASGAQVDPGDVLPVLFDMQTIGRSRDTLPFFQALGQDDLTPEQRRQLLFWTADSYKNIGEYSRAAALYLQSAALTDPYAMDQWAKSARYQAAQMLAKAGDMDDARNLYQGLLNATSDPGQQALLRHELQSLLLKSASGNAPGP